MLLWFWSAATIHTCETLWNYLLKLFQHVPLNQDITSPWSGKCLKVWRLETGCDIWSLCTITMICKQVYSNMSIFNSWYNLMFLFNDWGPGWNLNIFFEATWGVGLPPQTAVFSVPFTHRLQSGLVRGLGVLGWKCPTALGLRSQQVICDSCGTWAQLGTVCWAHHPSGSSAGWTGGWLMWRWKIWVSNQSGELASDLEVMLD